MGLSSRIDPYRGRLREIIGEDFDRCLEDYRETWGKDDDPLQFFAWLHSAGAISPAELGELCTSPVVSTEFTADPSVDGGAGGHNFAFPQHQGVQILGTVGRGGMGEILLARQPDLHRVVALKAITAAAARKPVLMRRFFNEAQITAQLDHPNIVPIYALETSASETPAFSMKLIRGSTLSDLISQCRKQIRAATPLSKEHRLPARLDHFIKICDAMSYAHSRGVLHRDLKPVNIMVGPFGEVYVMDWGIARLLSSENDPGLTTLATHLKTAAGDDVLATQIGHAIGTPPYMSPEQARGENDTLAPASDQFALGLMLQELITLRRARPGRAC